jgi:monofunctional glycosyltransferase
MGVSRGKRGWTRRLTRGFHVLLALLLVVPLALVVLYRFVPPVSTLMLARWVMLKPVSRSFVPLDAMAPALARAVIASEDARFCRHAGVDWDALREVIEEADEDGPSRGASTVAMQTARNVFLWQGRSYLRKALEIPLALAIDAVWSKRRVMEVYLNIAEWGDGIFGAEAAARYHFGKSARVLTPREAALLVAVLPNPLRRSAKRPSPHVVRKAAVVLARTAPADANCLDLTTDGR